MWCIYHSSTAVARENRMVCLRGLPLALASARCSVASDQRLPRYAQRGQRLRVFRQGGREFAVESQLRKNEDSQGTREGRTLPPFFWRSSTPVCERPGTIHLVV